MGKTYVFHNDNVTVWDEWPGCHVLPIGSITFEPVTDVPGWKNWGRVTGEPSIKGVNHVWSVMGDAAVPKHIRTMALLVT